MTRLRQMFLWLRRVFFPYGTTPHSQDGEALGDNPRSMLPGYGVDRRGYAIPLRMRLVLDLTVRTVGVVPAGVRVRDMVVKDLLGDIGLYLSKGGRRVMRDIHTKERDVYGHRPMDDCCVTYELTGWHTK